MYSEEFVKKTEDSLQSILQSGEEVIKNSASDVAYGWIDAAIGDTVYFRSYDDANDSVIVSKGEVVGIETLQYRVFDNPSINSDSNSTHNETSISYTILWGSRKVNINARYVYRDKLRACLVALYDTINSYFII